MTYQEVYAAGIPTPMNKVKTGEIFKMSEGGARYMKTACPCRSHRHTGHYRCTDADIRYLNLDDPEQIVRVIS